MPGDPVDVGSRSPSTAEEARCRIAARFSGRRTGTHDGFRPSQTHADCRHPCPYVVGMVAAVLDCRGQAFGVVPVHDPLTLLVHRKTSAWKGRTPTRIRRSIDALADELHPHAPLGGTARASGQSPPSRETPISQSRPRRLGLSPTGRASILWHDRRRVITSLAALRITRADSHTLSKKDNKELAIRAALGATSTSLLRSLRGYQQSAGRHRRGE